MLPSHTINIILSCISAVISFAGSNNENMSKLKMNTLWYIISLYLLSAPAFKLVNMLNLTKKTVKFEHCVRSCCHFDNVILLFKYSKKFQMSKRMKIMEGWDVTFVVTPIPTHEQYPSVSVLLFLVPACSSLWCIPYFLLLIMENTT